ncbi:hypothetical protein M3Y96_00676000 [Aphelenchoides besseyi]|nr:hypothetical protein M3Y96_00676000 [Aphelenchoides besseyi]
MLFNSITVYMCVLGSFFQLLHATADLIDDELDELIKTLKTDGIVSSEKTHITRTQPCLQISASNVTIPRAISRKSKKMVEIDPTIKFNVSYCETITSKDVAPKTCAVDSVCTTVYRWKKAKTRSMLFGMHNLYVDDHILIPTSCMCVLGLDSTPIIIL